MVIPASIALGSPLRLCLVASMPKIATFAPQSRRYFSAQQATRLILFFLLKIFWF